jgi:hypothetical protein
MDPLPRGKRKRGGGGEGREGCMYVYIEGKIENLSSRMY